MKNLGMGEIEGVRIGKHISLFVEAANETEAKSKVKEACKKLLANQIMEGFSFNVSAC
jgi:phosphoribosylformylglycinamidine synthase